MNPPAPTGRLQAAAIFDVDGTVCATRSTSSLVWLRRQQQPAWRHRLWLASLLWRAPLALAADTVSRQWADRMVYAQFGGLSRQGLAGDVQRCCDELLLPACFPAALAQIAWHHAAGHRVVLLSGGIDMVLAPLARALGAELLAQRLLADGDRLNGRHASYAVLEGAPAASSQGESKVQALLRHAAATGIDLAASSAYGDSINDAAMLGAVGRAVAINPDRRLARIAAARGWEVRHWLAGDHATAGAGATPA